MFAAAQTTLQGAYHGSSHEMPADQQPLQILKAALTAFAPEVEEPTTLFRRIAPYFTRMNVQAGAVLWNKNDHPNSFYVIESGVLRANREMDDLHFCSVETMLPATCVM